MASKNDYGSPLEDEHAWFFKKLSTHPKTAIAFFILHPSSFILDLGL